MAPLSIFCTCGEWRLCEKKTRFVYKWMWWSVWKLAFCESIVAWRREHSDGENVLLEACWAGSRAWFAIEVRWLLRRTKVVS